MRKVSNELRFGFDLEVIELVQNYLIENYKVGVDYEMFIERGDDVMNACILKFDFKKDLILKDLIDQCNGQGDWDESFE